jgi:hypothetical protein
MKGGASGFESLRPDDRLEVVERGDVVASSVFCVVRGVPVPYVLFSCTAAATPLSSILLRAFDLISNPGWTFPLPQKLVGHVRCYLSTRMLSLILLARPNGYNLRLGRRAAMIERFSLRFLSQGPALTSGVQLAALFLRLVA